jgi:hypothetical protein
MWSVRYYRNDGARLRLRCESREEAEFQRARLVYEGVPSAPTSDAPDPDSPTSMTLKSHWPVWAADARGRLATSTMREYERLWDRRLRPKFGHLPLDAIKPRDVAQWRAELLDGGRRSRGCSIRDGAAPGDVQVAIEWGEATASTQTSVAERMSLAAKNVARNASRPSGAMGCTARPRP